jgi:hypothetical protein
MLIWARDIDLEIYLSISKQALQILCTRIDSIDNLQTNMDNDICTQHHQRRVSTISQTSDERHG